MGYEAREAGFYSPHGAQIKSQRTFSKTIDRVSAANLEANFTHKAFE
jgi:hypothetical protein